MSINIRTLVDDFVSKLEGAVREQLLDRLNASLGGATSAIKKNGVKIVKPAKARPTETKALSAARKVQGKYLGMLRTATGSRRAKAKSIVKKEGVGAALKFLALKN